MEAKPSMSPSILVALVLVFVGHSRPAEAIPPTWLRSLGIASRHPLDTVANTSSRRRRRRQAADDTTTAANNTGGVATGTVSGGSSSGTKDLQICSVLGGLDVVRLRSSDLRSRFSGAIEDAEFMREHLSESATGGVEHSVRV